MAYPCLREALLHLIPASERAQVPVNDAACADWIDTEQVLLTLIGPRQEIWRRVRLVIHAFIGHDSQLSIPPVITDLIHQWLGGVYNATKYPNASTAVHASTIYELLLQSDVLRKSHLETLWTAITAPAK